MGVWEGQYRLGDTIAAVAAGEGGGAVGLVRVSGPGSWNLVLGLVEEPPARVEAQRAYVRWLVDGGGRALDEVVLLFYRAPRSYTGEDVVEVFCHSGRGNLQRVLGALIEAGARQAGPGEFTLRAFLGGKLDLVQAEAVAALVEAETRQAAEVAARLLKGELSGRVRRLRERIHEIRVGLEAEMEFPDEDVDVDEAGLVRELREVEAGLRRLAGSYQHGRVVRRGARVVLVGRSNAGKSSLFNRLLGDDRVVVDEAPGTTRDFVEAGRVVGGEWVVFVDTAGWRRGAGRVEERALERAWREVEAADLVLFVLDGSVGVGEAEEWLWGRLRGREVLMVANKADLVGRAGRKGVEEGARNLGGGVDVWVSALTGKGVEELEEAVARVVGRQGEGVVLVVEERQARLLGEAAEALRGAVEAVGLGWDVVAEELLRGERAVAAVLGEGLGMDVLEEIFSRFCIGK